MISSWSLVLGILIGFLLSFLSYWWIGTMSLSTVVALIVSGGIIIAKPFQRKYMKEEGKR